jgi:hypothetical protein
MDSPRAAVVYHFVSPVNEVNAGIWALFAGATVLLGFRVWCRLRRSGLWWDDYILISAWVSYSLAVKARPFDLRCNFSSKLAWEASANSPTYIDSSVGNRYSH